MTRPQRRSSAREAFSDVALDAMLRDGWTPEQVRELIASYRELRDELGYVGNGFVRLGKRAQVVHDRAVYETREHVLKQFRSGTTSPVPADDDDDARVTALVTALNETILAQCPTHDDLLSALVNMAGHHFHRDGYSIEDALGFLAAAYLAAGDRP